MRLIAISNPCVNPLFYMDDIHNLGADDCKSLRKSFPLTIELYFSVRL
jgi:hypothetical protein